MKKTLSLSSVLLIGRNSRNSRPLEQAIHKCCPAIEINNAKSAKEGLQLMLDRMYDAVFFDYTLSDTEFDLLEEVKKKNINSPVVVIVKKGKEIQAAEAIKKGACDYLIEKSYPPESLYQLLEKIQNISILKREKQQEREQQEILFRQIYKSQKWWQNIIDSITDYLFVIDKNYRILRTNKAFAGLFGKEPADIIMKPYYELFGLDHPHEWCIPPEKKNNFVPRSVERKINDTVYLISCFPIFFDEHEAAVYIMKDITETRRLKDQIYHLDKLSSLGTLTSGVAHELNNPLTGIIGYTEMLLMKDENETTKKYLRNIYDSAIRCKRIVENMLTFSRQKPSQKSLENINDIIDKTIELHEYWLRSINIEIVRNYEEIPYVAVDRQQMQQVILNLLINAEHAISETDRRGRIEFKTTYDIDSKNIVVTVTDNGTGIPDEILPKIFDPFFTTKPVNKGTGLGLSIAHGIIAEQGGTIEAESKPGEGTSFIIKIPYKN
jgi:PAS domain S-box-containing protein